MRVDGYWTIGTSYLWKVKDVLPIRNLALYAGVQLVGGAIYDRIDDGTDGDIYGGSVFLTGRTHGRPADRRSRHDVDRFLESVVERRAARWARHDSGEGNLSLNPRWQIGPVTKFCW